MMLIQHSVNSDWLFNTQSKVLQADWSILEINEEAILNIIMPSIISFFGMHADITISQVDQRQTRQ